jgi:acyl carrier protein
MIKMNTLFNALSVVQMAVNKATCQNLTNVTTATTMESFGMTTIQLHGFHMRLQAALQITIPWETVQSWETVNDAVTYLNGLICSPNAE